MYARRLHPRQRVDARFRSLFVDQPDIAVARDRRTLENVGGRNVIRSTYGDAFRIEAGPRRNAKARKSRGDEQDGDEHPKDAQTHDQRRFDAAAYGAHAALKMKRSIASATPSSSTPATIASAFSVNSGGAVPIATPKPALASSGTSFHESPIAIVSASVDAVVLRNRAQRMSLINAGIDDFDEFRLTARNVRVACKPNAQLLGIRAGRFRIEHAIDLG